MHNITSAISCPPNLANSYITNAGIILLKNNDEVNTGLLNHIICSLGDKFSETKQCVKSSLQEYMASLKNQYWQADILSICNNP
jgi:hypothetical protein